MGVYGAAVQGVLGVDSTIQEGIADRKQAESNIELARDAANASLQRGTEEAGAIRNAGGQLQQAQAFAYANSGVDVSVGTAANVIASTAAAAERDAVTAENNAMREAWGYKKHGIAFQQQAGLNASRRNREIAGTVLGTAGSMASAYSKYGTLSGTKKDEGEK